MEKLPSIITQILAPMVGHLSLNQLADSADKIFSNGENNINQVHTPTDREEPWMKAIAALQKQIEQLQLTMRSRLRSPTLSQRNNKCRPRSSSRRRHGDRDICYYHNKFGSRARKCQPPCKLQQNQGKRHNQQVTATNSADKNCLFYGWDRKNKSKFLIDTGAAISVIPYKNEPSAKPSLFRLPATNGSPIETYGNKSLTLNIDMRRDYTRSFIIAKVQMLILGADFLTHYDLAVHMNFRTLSDNTTNIKTTGTRTHHNTTAISVATYHSREYLDILNQYSDLLQPMKYTGSNTHQTKHYIRTSGQPAYFCPRRLPPHKLQFAKKEFDQMLHDGIIQPSDSPYASPLHLVPKPGSTDFRICVDYRRLNA